MELFVKARRPLETQAAWMDVIYEVQGRHETQGKHIHDEATIRELRSRATLKQIRAYKADPEVMKSLHERWVRRCGVFSG